MGVDRAVSRKADSEAHVGHAVIDWAACRRVPAVNSGPSSVSRRVVSLVGTGPRESRE